MNAAILENPWLAAATGVRLEACHDLLEARAIWRAIEAGQPAWDFNATWISCRTWARHFANGEVPVFKIIADGRVPGLFPAITTTRSKGGVSFRVLHSPGNEHWWTGYPIIGGEAKEAIRALVLALLQDRDWDVLEIGPMVAECPPVKLLVAAGEEFNLMPAACHQEDDWRLGISGDWEEYYKTRGANLRQTVARGGRRLAARGEVTFEVWAGGPGFFECFEEFCEIEGSGWKGRAGTAIRCEQAVRNFHEDLMRSAAERGQLRLFFLRLNGRAVASIETILHEGVAYLIKLGRDEAFDACWPGHVAFKRMLEYCFRAGDAHTLDMGIGGGAHGGYKERWGTEKREYITLRFFHPKTIHGALARGWFSTRLLAAGAKQIFAQMRGC
jgi:CelD/BcsL family acetyltransferase involved in cellulose biosynthesis